MKMDPHMQRLRDAIRSAAKDVDWGQAGQDDVSRLGRLVNSFARRVYLRRGGHPLTFLLFTRGGAVRNVSRALIASAGRKAVADAVRTLAGVGEVAAVAVACMGEWRGVRASDLPFDQESHDLLTGRRSLRDLPRECRNRGLVVFVEAPGASSCHLNRERGDGGLCPAEERHGVEQGGLMSGFFVDRPGRN